MSGRDGGVARGDGPAARGGGVLVASGGTGAVGESVTDAVGDVVATVAARMEEDLEGSSERVLVLLETEFTQMRGDRQWSDLLRASIASNIETNLHALRHGFPGDGIPPPAAAAEYARRMAQHGIPIAVLVRAYRLALASLQDEFLRRMADVRTTPAGDEICMETMLLAARHVMRVSYTYIDSVSEQLVDIYDDERDRWETGGNSARAERVRKVLVGEDDDEHDTVRGLGYDLEQTHLAALLWLPEGAVRGSGPVLLERASRRLRAIIGATAAPLLVAADQMTAWAWYPVEPVGVADPGSARARAEWDAQWAAGHAHEDQQTRVSVSLGTVAAGVDGFRRSHEHAALARSVAAMAGRPAGRATGYDEPGLSAVAMLCTDVRATAVWMEETLGPLAQDSEFAARMRETIRTFYRHGASHKSAATALHLHANTVKYRVRKAEELLGRPLQSNRSDIELAVSICYWLGPEVLSH